MKDHLRDLRLRPDGTIDCEYYSNRARQRWAMAPRQDEQEVPAKSPFGQVKLFALAFAGRSPLQHERGRPGYEPASAWAPTPAGASMPETGGDASNRQWCPPPAAPPAGSLLLKQPS
jgi:hypothetical protein